MVLHLPIKSESQWVEPEHQTKQTNEQNNKFTLSNMQLDVTTADLFYLFPKRAIVCSLNTMKWYLKCSFKVLSLYFMEIPNK